MKNKILIGIGVVFLLLMIIPWESWIPKGNATNNKVASGSALVISGGVIDISDKKVTDQTVIELDSKNYIIPKAKINAPFYENNITGKEFDKRFDIERLQNNIHSKLYYEGEDYYVYRIMNCNDIGFANVFMNWNFTNPEKTESILQYRYVISYLPAGDSCFVQVGKSSKVLSDGKTYETMVEHVNVTVDLSEAENIVSKESAVSKLIIKHTAANGFSLTAENHTKSSIVLFCDILLYNKGQLVDCYNFDNNAIEASGSVSFDGILAEEGQIKAPEWDDYIVRYRVAEGE